MPEATSSLSIISVLYSCQDHHLPEKAFPMFLGVVKFPSSNLPLLNCVTPFWAQSVLRPGCLSLVDSQV